MSFHKDLVGTDLHESKIPAFDNADVEKVNSPGKALKEGTNIELIVDNTTRAIEISVSKALPVGDVIGTSDTQTLSNKDLVDDSTKIVDETDDTKKLAFELGGSTTGTIGTIATQFTTTKTLTLPDATDTLVGKATTDILTNKTLLGTTNDIAANRLRGASTIEIDNTSTPVGGQAVIYNSTSGKAQWSTITAVGTGVSVRGGSVTGSVPNLTITNAIVANTELRTAKITFQANNTTNLTFQAADTIQGVWLEPIGNNTTNLYIQSPQTFPTTSGDDTITVNNNDSVDIEAVVYAIVTTADTGGGAGQVWKEDVFIATSGQTIFTLSQFPTQVTAIFVYGNGLFIENTEYTVSGAGNQTITFDTGRTLGDKIVFKYLIAVDVNWFEDVFNIVAPTTTVVLTNTPFQATGLYVYINGLFRTLGPTEDYTVNDSTITFNFSLAVSDVVAVKYQF